MRIRDNLRCAPNRTSIGECFFTLRLGAFAVMPVGSVVRISRRRQMVNAKYWSDKDC